MGDLLELNMVEPFDTPTDFERHFDVMYWRKVIQNNWMISVYAAALYLVFIFGGQFLMKNRKPFQLNGLLAMWNIMLSVMSIWTFYRTYPEMMHLYSNSNGLYYTMCEWKSHTSVSAFWGFVILMSKIVEFGDTVFVVLRKKPLKFIHYYHHVVTATSWWYMYPYYEPVQMWYLNMNVFVHSVMYPYYALRAMKFSMPKIVPMAVTTIQIVQMFVGLFLNVYSVWLMYIIGTPADCPHRTGFGVLIGFTIYIIFAVMFFQFFVSNYLGKAKVRPKKS